MIPLLITLQMAFGDEATSNLTPNLTKVVTTRELAPHEVLYNEAATSMNNGDPKACMKTLAKVDQQHLHSEQFLSLGYICAIAASHLDAADMLRKELGLEYMPPSSLDIHHAWMLRRQDKSKEALDVLTPEGWNSTKPKSWALRCKQYCMQICISGQKRFAGSPYVEQNAQLYIAQQLNGHISKSKSLYDRVCPNVQNAQMGCGSIIDIQTHRNNLTLPTDTFYNLIGFVTRRIVGIQ